MKALFTLNRFFWKYRRRFFLGIIFVIISNIFGIFPPQVIRYAVDLIKESVFIYRFYEGGAIESALYSSFTKGILFFGAIVLLLALIRGWFLYYTRQTLIFMSRLIEFDMKNELFEKYQSLSMSFYRKYSTGNLMARISEDVGKVRMYLGPAVMYGINMLVLSVLVIWVMLEVNTRLTLYVLAPLPVLSIGIYYVNNLILKRSGQLQQKVADLTTFAQESYAGIRIIKSFGLGGLFEQRMKKQLDEYRSDAMALVRADALFFPLTLLLIGLSTIITVYIGGMQMIAGEITAGNIAEFVIYVNLLTWPVMSIGWIASMVQQAAASQQRILEFMSMEPDIAKEVGEELNVKGEIRFENVSFTYPVSGIRAVHNLSFTLKPGKTLGIIGRTASGKTTIANLLLRHFDATEGEIRIDGKLITGLHAGRLREQIGYVPQEAFLFSDTIARNVAFSGDGYSTEEILEVCKRASLEDTLTQFPDGLQTVVGERGVTLSGGQKQRISIARALLHKPQIYIFDDCLSALDTKTENDILSELRNTTRNTSTILISHRISTVAEADEIIVLDGGEVIERGTHSDLLNLKGYYARMFKMQQYNP